MHSCVRVALSELLLSGVTTVADLSVAHPGWLDLLAESGMRVCIAPMFRSARWFTRNGHVVEYAWDPAAGEKAMAEAFTLVERAEQHESGRLFGMAVPSQIDTCTPELLKDSRDEARRRGISWQIHAAQSVSEFHEITRRHGFTPIGWLHEQGLLDDRAIIGHGIFLDDHPSTPWHTRRDLEILSETGTTVAHCPTVFARRGITLKHLGRYKRSGVNMGIGTDTYPHNMLDEMRLAAYLARTQATDPRSLTTTELFEAATVGGARALGRDDIGRLATGCRADFVMVDITHPMMRPTRDPVRSLIYAAGDRALKAVYVDGQQVVRDGEVLTMDYRQAAEHLQESQKRVVEQVPDATGRIARRTRSRRRASSGSDRSAEPVAVAICWDVVWGPPEMPPPRAALRLRAGWRQARGRRSLSGGIGSPRRMTTADAPPISFCEGHRLRGNGGQPAELARDGY